MVRRLVLFTAVMLAVLAGARCNNNDTVAGPGPIPQATATPAPRGAPTPTRTPPPPAAMRMVDVGAGGARTFVDRVSGTSMTTIPAGTTVQWVWVSGTHSTTSGTCPAGCQPDGQWDSGIGSAMTFTHMFPQPGTFPYFCSVHGAMMQGTVVVQ
jgi:plastocyanin